MYYVPFNIKIARRISGLFLGSSLLLTAVLAPCAAAFPVAQAPAQAPDTQVANPITSQQLTSQLATLRQLLNAKDWAAADRETRRLLTPAVDLWGASLGNATSINLIQAMDQAWIEASHGRFGFSVQSRIWREAIAQHPNNEAAAVNAFRDRVGWARNPDLHTDESYNFYGSGWLFERDLTYSLQAPMGHLPWLGVNGDIISATLQLGGSGTIDAIFLLGQRFYQVIPTFLNHVHISLNTPPIVGTLWNTLRLHHQIDLTMLVGDDCPAQIKVQAISPNSQLLAVSGDRLGYAASPPCRASFSKNPLELWNLPQGQRIATLLNRSRAENADARVVAFSPDSKQIAAGMSDGTLRLWSVATGEAVRRFAGHQAEIKAIAISPDGQRLISGSADQTFKVWNLQTGKLLRTIALQPSDGELQTFQLSPNGQRLAVATQSTIQLWNVLTGQRIQTLVNRQETNQATTPQNPLNIAFSPDGTLLAATDADYSIKLWNADRGYRIITLRGHRQDVRAIAFSPYAQTLATSSADHTVRLWDLQTYQLSHTFTTADPAQATTVLNGINWLAFSPDGQMLAAPAPVFMQMPNTLPSAELEPTPGMVMWNIQTKQQITELPQISWLAFSPNNQFIVSEGMGARVQVWQR